jgi:hypothetical protein
MTPDQYKSVLSDTTHTPNSSQSQPPKYKDMTQVYRNGANLCSAHEILIKVLDRQDKKLDEMDNKLDQLMINEGIDEDKNMTRDKWKDRAYGALITLIGLIAFELVKYFTVL